MNKVATSLVVLMASAVVGCGVGGGKFNVDIYVKNQANQNLF